MNFELFKGIAQAAQSVESIAFVDKWRDQLVNMSSEFDFPFPAVFIEIEEIDYLYEHNSNAQTGIAIVKIHLVLNNNTDDYNSQAKRVESDFSLLNELTQYLLKTVPKGNITYFSREFDREIMTGNQHSHYITQFKAKIKTKPTHCNS